MTMRVLGLLLAAAWAVLTPQVALGNITFQFVTDMTSYSGASSFDVPIYLQETVTGGSQSLSQDPSTKGMFSYGIYVTQTSAGGTSTISKYVSNSSFNSNISQSSSGSLPANSIDYSATVPFGSASGPNLTPVNGQNGVYRLQVGTLTINSGSSTTFTLTSMNSSTSGLLDPGDSANAQSDNTFTLPSPGYDLDAGGTQKGPAGTVNFTGNNAGVYTFTVAAVPEPGSLALGAVATAAVALGAWRRWRNRVAAPV